jgi:hypothetical protein
MRQRGQALVEMVSLAPFVIGPLLALVQLVLYVRADVRAERLAGQVAVLTAQHRPIPDRLRDGAWIEVEGRTVTVSIAVPAVLPKMRARATASAEVE